MNGITALLWSRFFFVYIWVQTRIRPSRKVRFLIPRINPDPMILNLMLFSLNNLCLHHYVWDLVNIERKFDFKWILNPDVQTRSGSGSDIILKNGSGSDLILKNRIRIRPYFENQIQIRPYFKNRIRIRPRSPVLKSKHALCIFDVECCYGEMGTNSSSNNSTPTNHLYQNSCNS